MFALSHYHLLDPLLKMQARLDNRLADDNPVTIAEELSCIPVETIEEQELYESIHDSSNAYRELTTMKVEAGIISHLHSLAMSTKDKTACPKHERLLGVADKVIDECSLSIQLVHSTLIRLVAAWKKLEADPEYIKKANLPSIAWI